jgi:hypothetical protein
VVITVRTLVDRYNAMMRTVGPLEMPTISFPDFPRDVGQDLSIAPFKANSRREVMVKTVPYDLGTVR